MIKFFRNNAEWIIWGIILFFGATMFTGVFFGGSLVDAFKGDRQSAPQTSKLAMVGPVAVDPLRFENALSQTLSLIQQRQPNINLSPDIQEMIQYDAFNKALQETIFYEQAKKNEIEVSRGEVKNGIETALIQFELKNKKELKERLKDWGYTYDQFEAIVKKDITIQKYLQSLMGPITVSDDDVEKKYTVIEASHILLPNQEEVSEQKSMDVYYEVLEGLSFPEAVKKYSVDTGTKETGGKLGKIRMGQTIPEFEEVAYSLAVGEVSKPVLTKFGYHIIKVTKRSPLPKPANIDYEKEKQQILAAKKDTAIQFALEDYLEDNELNVVNPSLRAYQMKLEGNLEGALGAYQSLASQNPYSPVPHYFMGQLYLGVNQMEEAEREIEKANVKAELTESYAFPQLHLLEGAYYAKKNNKKAQIEAYDKALALASNNAEVLDTLKQKFNELGQKKKVKEVSKEIDRLNKELEEEKEAREEKKVPEDQPKEG